MVLFDNIKAIVALIAPSWFRSVHQKPTNTQLDAEPLPCTSQGSESYAISPKGNDPSSEQKDDLHTSAEQDAHSQNEGDGRLPASNAILEPEMSRSVPFEIDDLGECLHRLELACEIENFKLKRVDLHSGLSTYPPLRFSRGPQANVVVRDARTTLLFHPRDFEPSLPPTPLFVHPIETELNPFRFAPFEIASTFSRNKEEHYRNRRTSDATQTRAVHEHGSSNNASWNTATQTTVSPLLARLQGSEHVIVENRCSFCGVTFRTRGQLNSHVNRRHVRRFICGLCSQAFNLNTDLKRHSKSVHVDEALQQSKTLRCTNEACKMPNKVWKREDNLKRHMGRCLKKNAKASGSVEGCS